MLRMYFLQPWYGLADEALEDAVDDSQALRGFLGIDLERESVPDATTLLGFRRRLEAQALTKSIFETVKDHLRARGLLLEKGTLVDASLFNAPPSTKNLASLMKTTSRHWTRVGSVVCRGGCWRI
jgi:transposase, IS5 family